MNRKFITASLLTLVTLSSNAFAHNGEQHKGKPIEGKASAISATGFKVATEKGEKVVEINKGTKFELGMDGQKGSVTDLKDGAFVMVEGTTLATGQVVATEVMVHPADNTGMEDHSMHKSK